MAASQPALQLRPGTAWVPRPGLCLYPCRHAAGRRLASGFSRARPAGRPWEGHSPPASHPAQGRPEGRPWARRPWWLQDPRWSCHQCSGPPPCTPKKRVPAGEAVSGAGEPSVWGTWAPQDRGPLAGRGRAQQGGPLLGPNPSGGGQDRFSRLPATAGTDSGPGHEVAAPRPPAALSTLPTSWVKRLAGASGSCCPLQVT